MAWQALWTDDFEAGVGDWIVDEETFEQSSAQAHGGTYSAKMMNAGGGDPIRAGTHRGFTRQTTKLKLDFYAYFPSLEAFSIGVKDTVEDEGIFALRFYSGGIMYYDGAAYQSTGKTYSYSTWVHIEIECDFEANTITLEVNGSAGTITYRVADPQGSDEISISTYSVTASKYAYWDDIGFYEWSEPVSDSYGFIM